MGQLRRRTLFRMENENFRPCALSPGTTAYTSSVSTTSLQRTRAGPQSHPEPAELLRFLRGEASQAEAQAGVRHLLTGCPQCMAVTRPVWRLAEHELRVLPTYRKKASSRAGRLEAIR